MADSIIVGAGQPFKWPSSGVQLNHQWRQPVAFLFFFFSLSLSLSLSLEFLITQL